MDDHPAILNNVTCLQTAYNCTFLNVNISDHVTYTLASTNKSWNLSKRFLPGYFLYNCSAKITLADIVQRESSLAEESDVPSQSSNGNTFIALLLVVSGLCVSAWMLTLLLFLSPKHKSKPLTALVATILYTVAATINLNSLTQISRYEFYHHGLDIIRIHSEIYSKNHFKVPQIFSQISINAALFEIVLRISDHSYKWIYCSIGGLIILVYAINTTYYEIRYSHLISVFVTRKAWVHPGWRLMRVILKLGIMAWVSGALAYHTIVATDVSRVSYSRRLIALALFNWFLLLTHVCLDLSLATVFRNDWLVKSWLELMPYFFEIVLITTLWEWIYNISLLEKNYELVDILGRRVKEKTTAPRLGVSFDTSRLQQLRGYTSKEAHSSHLTAWSSGTHASAPEDAPEDDEQFQPQSFRGSTLDGQRTTDQLGTRESSPGPLDEDDDENDQIVLGEQLARTNDMLVNRHSADDDFEIAYEYDYAGPPSFQPAPGFDYADYWPSKG